VTGPDAAPLALVTGAAGGIGGGVARMLRDRGHRIIAVDLDEAAAARAAAALGPGTIPVAADLRRREEVAALAARIREEWSLDMLVCNAGVIAPGEVADADPATLHDQLDVMLGAPIQLIAAAAPGMRDRGAGAILATVSMGGILPLPGSATYSAAKAGLRAFLTALDAELDGSGVRVAGVYPSGVDTAMLRFEARHGGSVLNFVGDVFTVDQVVAAYERALDGRALEVYLPWSDSLLSRLVVFTPARMKRLLPFFERLGRRGHAKYLARIDALEAAER